jgi:hypothetical protein
MNGRRRVANAEALAERPTGRAALLAAALLLLAGCAAAPPLPQEPADTAALCRAQIARVDAAVERGGVGDARAARIEGFPWLRVTRPLASFRDAVDRDARFQAWLQRLTATARRARRAELANLAQAARRELQATWRAPARAADLPTELASGLSACRKRLNRGLLNNARARSRLRAAAVAPDAYVPWQRALGFYPLAWRVARPQIVAAHNQRDRVFGEPAEAPVREYAVPVRNAGAGGRDAVRTARAVNTDALGIPQPDARARARLFAAHAPVWAVGTQSDADRPGALRLESGRPVATPAQPVEYRRLSWTRFGDAVLLQLNYLIWFPERPPEGPVDLYSGHLDGVFWRVTLGPDGRPLAYDSMHACGCYYTLLPTEGWQVAPVPDDQEPVASPRKAPAVEPGERLRVRLEARSHYIAGLDTRERPVTARDLAPLPYRQLRSLPTRASGHESAFAPSGLIPSSARTERFFFWPLGVPSAGAMRQWGTHAIAFVGRRHFDDPRLLERLLEPADDD